MVRPHQPSPPPLLGLLEQLDRRLHLAMAEAQVLYGAGREDNPYRGVHIDEAEVKRLLEQQPGDPTFSPQAGPWGGFSFDNFAPDSALIWLQTHFRLCSFDLGVLAIALAPELDRRYERLYAYLQDDGRCKRPTVDLCLHLLCSSATEKLVRRSDFEGQGPLVRQGLIQLIPDPNQPEPSLLAHLVKLDPQGLHLLLDIPGLDDRLQGFCQLVEPSLEPILVSGPASVQQRLPELVQAYWQSAQHLKLYFYGPDQDGQRRAALAIANRLSAPLLRVSLARLLNGKLDYGLALDTLLREARFRSALLYIEDLEKLNHPDHQLHREPILKSLNDYGETLILVGDTPWYHQFNCDGLISIEFSMADFDERRFYWRHYLEKAEIAIASQELDSLSDRFRLTPHQIFRAVHSAVEQNRWQRSQTQPRVSLPGPGAGVEAQDLFAVARVLSKHDLTSLSQPIHPHYGWEDIVLPTPQKTLLREICDQVKYQNLVWKTWGFNHQRSASRGLNIMFSGTPGTGKTMAAEVIAKELELDLYKIDLSQIVSKYIGETEKNLNAIFTAATNANAILLFDEADALFGRRGEVKDAHDRYANIEVSYLLQKMEEYQGVTILTTNLRSNIDEAFVRRLQFIIEFPFPGEKQRYQIWQKAFPTTAPCSADLDWSLLARRYDVSGANIRNIAVTAAFFAAVEGSPITMAHIVQGVRREYQKMGKILKD